MLVTKDKVKNTEEELLQGKLNFLGSVGAVEITKNESKISARNRKAKKYSKMMQTWSKNDPKMIQK